MVCSVDVEWGPLWLLHQYKGRKIDAANWFVELPVKGIVAGDKALIPLKVKFERALADLDKWPAQ